MFDIDNMTLDQCAVISEVLDLHDITQEKALACIVDLVSWESDRDEILDILEFGDVPYLLSNSVCQADKYPLNRVLLALSNEKAPYIPCRLEKNDFMKIIYAFGEYNRNDLIQATWKIVMDELYSHVCLPDEEIKLRILESL